MRKGKSPSTLAFYPAPFNACHTSCWLHKSLITIYLAMASCVSAKSLWYMWSSVLRRRKHSRNTSKASLIPTLSDNRTPFTKSSSASWARRHSSSIFFSKLHSRFWQVPMTPSLTEDSFMAFSHLGQAKAEKHNLLFSISSSLKDKTAYDKLFA